MSVMDFGCRLRSLSGMGQTMVIFVTYQGGIWNEKSAVDAVNRAQFSQPRCFFKAIGRPIDNDLLRSEKSFSQKKRDCPIPDSPASYFPVYAPPRTHLPFYSPQHNTFYKIFLNKRIHTDNRNRRHHCCCHTQGIRRDRHS